MRPARFASPVLWTAVALVILLAIPPLSTARALAIWVVIVTAVVLLLLVRRSRELESPQSPSSFEEALRARKPARSRAAELVQMERALTLGTADAVYAHRRLLPLLRAAASARLAARHGIELERRAEAASALLGPEVWDLLRPDRPPPKDRHGPGVPRERIVAVVERVESL